MDWTTHMNPALQVLEHLPFAVAIWHLDDEDDPGSLRMLYANPSCDVASRAPIRTLVGRTMRQSFPAYLDTPFPAAYAGLARREASGFEDYGELVYGDARLPESVYEMGAVALDGGHVAVTYHNITRQRIAEQALADREAQLQRARHEMQQFALAVAHDLAEPLRSINVFTELIAEHLKDVGQLTDEVGEYAGFVEAGVARMARRLEALLALSKVSVSGHDPQTVVATEVLGEVQIDLGRKIEESGATIVVGDLPTVVADPDRLHAVFLNLVGNGLKYTGDAPPRVEITGGTHDDHWWFEVRDEGIGIDPAHHEAIFDIFKRLHHEDQYEGEGAGLALVHSIVTRHGGQISVASALGEGAVFRFTLPR